MGYSLRKGLVEENVELLEGIRIALETTGSARIPVEDPGELYAKQYSVRRLLKATDIFKSEAGGKYAGLGSQVRVTVQAEKGELVILPRKSRTSIEVIEADEVAALEDLKHYPGTMTNLVFSPSDDFDEETLVLLAKREGWRVDTASKRVEGRRISYVATRELVEEGGFSRISRAGGET
ncbi:MAG: hypothetical protein J5I35_07660 [Methanothrix harundinacea]|nr:hypothetical protein [Methanothrix harundinacea]